jgi:uncharacterized protein (TIGR00251 family)
MKIKLKVHTNSSQDKINKNSEKYYEVWIKEKPIEGKANEYLVKILKRELRKKIKIISGFNSKIKFLEVE